MSSPGSATQLLADWRNGDHSALNQLLPIVYDELRHLAKGYLNRERPDHTLQATALVHEAYLRLVDQRDTCWENRAHFFGVAARLMREILVDHARGRNAAKRGGAVRDLPLDEVVGFFEERDVNLVALDEALNHLAAIDPQKSRTVELRFFGGLTARETAEVLGVSLTTVEREWRMAKVWLLREISRTATSDR